ncbi:MAG: hypothetical protein Q9219_002437 [cf. Caloplaca sp. 3 TL-2023]
MKFFTVSASLILIVPEVIAQSTGQPIIPSTLPSCAQSCPNLLQAQTACTAPPNPPPGGTYGIQCLCGFAPLAALKADAPTQICATCQPTDNAAIQSWYKGACGLGGGSAAGANAQNGQSTTATKPSSTLPTQATPAVSSNGVTVSGHPANAPNVAQHDWMSTHWRWVLMLIILALGLIGLAVGGVYLRRYIHRRRESREFGVSGPRRDLETWGPGQSVHDFGTAGVVNNGSNQEKGKERETNQAQEVPTSDRRNSRRLKKGWLLRKNRD